MLPMEARNFLWILMFEMLEKEQFEVIKIEPFYYIVKIKPERHIYVFFNKEKGNISITRLFQYCGFTSPIDVLDNPYLLVQYCQNIHNNY